MRQLLQLLRPRGRTDGLSCQPRRRSGPCLCRPGGWRRAPPISCRKSAISDTVPSPPTRRNLPSSPPDTKPVAAASGASANTAPSCTASFRQSDLSATETRCTEPSPSANAAAAPARSKRTPTTNASRSRWTPRVPSRNWAVVSLMQRRPCSGGPSPTPSRDGRGKETGAGALPLPLRAGVAEAVNTHHEPRHLTQPRNLRSHAATAVDSNSVR